MGRCLCAALLGLMLTPHAFADLKLANMEIRWGLIGPVRKSLEYCPGENVYVFAEVSGLPAEKDGNFNMVVTLELRSTQGRARYERVDPSNGITLFGLDSVPIIKRFTLPKDLEPGEYTVRLGAGAGGLQAPICEQKIVVKPVEFKIAAAQYYADADKTLLISPTLQVGQSFSVGASVLGYPVENGRIRFACEYWISDAKTDKPLHSPIRNDFDLENEQRDELPCIFMSATTTRAGNFTFHLRITDRTSKKSAELALPMRVVSGPK